MAGGGARLGAGRPKGSGVKRAAGEALPADRGATEKAPRAGRGTGIVPKVIPSTSDPLEYMRLVMADDTQPPADRMRAAQALLAKGAGGAGAGGEKPVKEEPVGKKAEAQARADDVAKNGSTFAPRKPPTLVRAK